MGMSMFLGAVALILSGIGVYVFLRLHHRRSFAVSETAVAKADAAVAAPPASQEPNDGVKLVLGVSPEQALMTITALPRNALLNSARRIEPDNSNLGRLSALLQAVPSVLASAELAQGQFMRVVINGPLAAAKDGIGMRPFVFAANGRIVEQARLFDPSRLSTLVNAAALFQIASVIVAQKHLADISRKLDDIKQGVNRIQAFQQEERKSAITGALRYFEQVAQAVLQGELSMPLRQKLEDYEDKLIGIQDHLNAEIQTEIKNIASLKDGTFRSDGLHDAILSQQGRLTDLNKQMLLCFRARAAGWQLLSAFPGEQHLKAARQSAIRDSMKTFAAIDGVLPEMEWEMNSKIDTMKSMFERQATIDAKKMELRTWTQSLVPTFLYESGPVDKQLVEGEAMLLEQQQELILAIRMDAGEVIESYHLEA